MLHDFLTKKHKT